MNESVLAWTTSITTYKQVTRIMSRINHNALIVFIAFLIWRYCLMFNMVLRYICMHSDQEIMPYKVWSSGSTKFNMLKSVWIKQKRPWTYVKMKKKYASIQPCHWNVTPKSSKWCWITRSRYNNAYKKCIPHIVLILHLDLIIEIVYWQRSWTEQRAPLVLGSKTFFITDSCKCVSFQNIV